MVATEIEQKPLSQGESFFPAGENLPKDAAHVAHVVTPGTALRRIEAAGFSLELVTGGLAISPASLLTESQRAFVKAHKAQILEELRMIVKRRDNSPVRVPPIPGQISSPIPSCGYRQWSYQHGCWLDEVGG